MENFFGASLHLLRYFLELKMRPFSGVLLLGLIVGLIGGCGRKVAVWAEKHANGNIKVEYQYYTDDKGNKVNAGYYRQYFEEGTLQVEDAFKDGERHGKRIEYYENGKVKVEETYREGTREGKRIEYYDDGTIVIERTFKDGKCISNC
jgi:antitoxin component YwqK of YwqJK toxin-antitoxin module